MEKIDLRRLLLLFFFFSVLLLRVDWARGQTSSASTTTCLAPGDIQIVYLQNTTTESFCFVTYVPIKSGTVITFTDNEWDNATSSLGTGEGTVTYTAPSDITAGTVICPGMGTMVLANAGDQIIGYQTQSGSTVVLTAITYDQVTPCGVGVANEGVYTTFNNTSNLTQVPAAVLPYAINLQCNTVDFRYTGTTSGDCATLAGAVDNSTNWTNTTGTVSNFTVTPTCRQVASFQIVSPTCVVAGVAGTYIVNALDASSQIIKSYGSTIDYSVTGGGTISSPTTVSCGTASFSYTPPTSGGTITLTAFNTVLGVSSSINVTVLAASIAPSATTICSGNSVTLTASGGTTYAWSTPPGGSTATVSHSPTSTTTYTVTVSNGSCSSTTSTTITVNTTPTPTISGTTSVCVNSNTTLTPSITGGEWSSGSPSVATIDPSTGVVLGLSAGSSVMTYSVTVTGCVGTTTTTVTVNPLPTLTIVNPPAVCSPTTVDITSASVQTTNTGTTTKYYDSYTLALAGGASNVATPAAISTSGTYYIRAELATGCYVVAPVTVTINTSPSFAPVAVQPTCLTNGSITFPALSGGTYTYSYSINGGAATSVSPSGGAITISVPMGVQTASTYSITVTRTDVTPNCPTVKTVNIAAIPFCVTPTAQVADPCSCNNDQTSDGSQTGTFNETVAVNGSGPGQTWTVTSVAPLVAGTAPTLTAGTVLSEIANSATNGIDDDGDGSTDEADEANMYNVMFQHTDDRGYTATIEGPAAVGTPGNQILSISNVCKYPEIIFGANPLGTYCVSGGSSMPSIALSATEATSMAGTTTFSGSGVSGTTFTPPGAGTYTITATFTSTAGTGKGGTAGTPVAPNNSCITKESKTTTVTDSRCTTFPQ